jgi:transposase
MTLGHPLLCRGAVLDSYCAKCSCGSTLTELGMQAYQRLQVAPSRGQELGSAEPSADEVDCAANIHRNIMECSSPLLKLCVKLRLL